MSTDPFFCLSNDRVYFVEQNTTQLPTEVFVTHPGMIDRVKSVVPDDQIDKRENAGWFSVSSQALLKAGLADLLVRLVASSPTDNHSLIAYQLSHILNARKQQNKLVGFTCN